MKRPRRSFLGFTWLGWLNFLFFQWIGIRLTLAVVNDENDPCYERVSGIGFLMALPMTRWYRFGMKIALPWSVAVWIWRDKQLWSEPTWPRDGSVQKK